jgi:hypothetical protein
MRTALFASFASRAPASRRARWAGLAVLLALAGCVGQAPPPEGLGMPCRSDLDCWAGGLSCLGKGEPMMTPFFDDTLSTCELSGPTCTLSCTTDADCASLGEDYACTQTGCGQPFCAAH